MLWQGTQNVSLDVEHFAPAPQVASRENPRLIVQKLCMLCIPCGSSWKNWTVHDKTLTRNVRELMAETVRVTSGTIN